MSTSLGLSRRTVRLGATAAVVVAGAGALLGMGEVNRVAARTTTVNLAGAHSYAVLAAGVVSSAGASAVGGDVGASTVTGLVGEVTGTVRTGDDVAQARADLVRADDAIASAAVTNQLTSVSGTLRPGVYGVSGALDVSGPLTLDAAGDADATFILKTDSSLTTTGTAKVGLAGGARACNVFWLAGDSASVDGTVVGSVLARTGITARSGADVTGRLLSRGGDVRLDAAAVRLPADCGGAAPPAAGTGVVGTQGTPAGGGSVGVGAAGIGPDGAAGTAGAGAAPGQAGASGAGGGDASTGQHRGTGRANGSTANSSGANSGGAANRGETHRAAPERAATGRSANAGGANGGGADGGATRDRVAPAGTRGGAGRSGGGPAADGADEDEGRPVVVAPDAGAAADRLPASDALRDVAGAASGQFAVDDR